MNKKVGLGLTGILISMTLVFALFYRSNVNDFGYSNSIENIFNILKEKPILLELDTVGDLYFHKTGFLSNWQMNIFGQFSPKTTTKILVGHDGIGLPIPKISYNEQFPIQSFRYSLQMPPDDVVNKLMLFQNDSNSIASKINDNLVFFEWTKENYRLKLYLLGGSGYFILSITHNTR